MPQRWPPAQPQQVGVVREVRRNLAHLLSTRRGVMSLLAIVLLFSLAITGLVVYLLRRSDSTATVSPVRNSSSGAEVAAETAATDPPVNAVVRPAVEEGGEPRLLTYEIVRELWHDPNAFTQGLEFDVYKGHEVFWESTGMYGRSEVREVDVATGAVRRAVRLPRAAFGEGLTRVGDRLLQLTWRSGAVYDYASVDSFHAANFTAFSGVTPRDSGLSDGWGLAYDGESLVVTDSSEVMHWLDPETLALQRSATVTDGSRPVPWLNELECINGEVWANVWMTPCLALVEPRSARVTGWLDLTGLRTRAAAAAPPGHRIDVLNGIAHDARTQRVYVTGKYWPIMFEIRVVPVPSPSRAALAAARRKCIPAAHPV